MQINLPNSGTFFFISDHCHVIENVSSASLLLSSPLNHKTPASSLSELTEKLKSGAMAFLKAGWLGTSSQSLFCRKYSTDSEKAIIPPGSKAHSD